MSDLPYGWRRARLRELVGADGTLTDGDWVESKDQDPTGSVRLIQLADVGDGIYLNKSSRFMTAEKARDLGCTFLQNGDVLISRMADPLGRACIFPGDIKPSVTVVDVCVVRTGANGVDHKWLTGAINSPQFRETAQLAASGTTRSRVSRSNLVELELLVPPMSEQRRIVSKIESLTARSRRAKEVLDAIPTLLEQFRQSVLAAAFRGDLTADWREKNPDVEPADVLLKRIRAERRKRWEEAELAKMRAKGKVSGDDRWKASYEDGCTCDVDEIHEEWFGSLADRQWQVVSLDAVCDATRTITYGIVLTGNPTPDGVPTVRCGDIKNFSIDLPSLKRVAKDIAHQFMRTSLEGGEVLIAIRGTVGATAVVSEGMKGMNISREVAMLPVLHGIDPQFVAYLLASPGGQRFLARHIKGVAQSGINLADLRTFPLPVPPLKEQREIVQRIDRVLNQIERVAGSAGQMMTELGTLDRSILAKAFRGELVEQDAADEPASVLLERIRAESATNGAEKPKRGRRAAGKSKTRHEEAE